MKYKFKYRKGWFWKTYSVVGHRYEESQDKMALYFENGSIREISHWKDCEVFLGVDWVLAVQKAKEKEAGQQLPLAVNTEAK